VVDAKEKGNRDAQTVYVAKKIHRKLNGKYLVEWKDFPEMS